MSAMNTQIVDNPVSFLTTQESANDVIVLDTYGPLPLNQAEPFLALDVVDDNRPDWISRQLVDATLGTRLGYASQRVNPHSLTRFVAHRTGICGLVQWQDIVFFVFPGAELTLPDTVIQLASQPALDKHHRQQPPILPALSFEHSGPQTVTKQAMILGAGLSTRFEPIAGDVTGYCKPAVPLVGDDSVIRTIALLLKKHGFTDIIVNTYFKSACLKALLTDIDGVNLIFIDEEAPSGTAGGLGKALAQNLVDTTQPIFIIQGDAVTDCDLTYLLNIHATHNALVTIGGQIVSDAEVDQFGIIQTDGAGTQMVTGDNQSGHVITFKEKPSLAEAGHSRFANSGFYVLSPDVLPCFEKQYQLCLAENRLYDYAKDFFPAVLQGIHAKTFGQDEAIFWAQVLPGYWNDIGNPAQYLQTLADIDAGDVALPNQTHYRRPLGEHHDLHCWPGTESIVSALLASGELKAKGPIIAAKPFTGKARC